MAEMISVSACDVWDYFQKNKGELKNTMHMIAENKEFGVEIYVTEEYDKPNIIVNADDVQVRSVTAIDEQDCYNLVSDIYNDYLTERALSSLGYDDDDDDYDGYRSVYYGGTYEEEREEELNIEDRESELSYALRDFLDVVMMGSEYEGTGKAYLIEEDCLDHFIEYIARKHKVDVYRPMYIQYEGEEAEYCEYPYDELEFDDEDNPIYIPD